MPRAPPPLTVPPGRAEPVVGDLTDATTLAPAVAGVDAVVLTHGSHRGTEAAEAVDHGAGRDVLRALDGAGARIALMTATGVTEETAGHDGKRRGQRLVRTSGLPCTIVRPGWLDAGEAGQRAAVMLQGDRRWAAHPSDGMIARHQIARVLVAFLTSPADEGLRASVGSWRLGRGRSPRRTSRSPWKIAAFIMFSCSRVLRGGPVGRAGEAAAAGQRLIMACMASG